MFCSVILSPISDHIALMICLMNYYIYIYIFKKGYLFDISMELLSRRDRDSSYSTNQLFCHNNNISTAEQGHTKLFFSKFNYSSAFDISHENESSLHVK